MSALTPRQCDFVQGVDAGKNVFLSGSAGTGKSFAINESVNHIIDGGRNVIKLAHQGISAVNIGGVTINRFLKIGLGKNPVETYKDRFLRNRTARGKRREGMTAARAIDVVMIDEISQVTEMQLQLLEYFFRVCRSPVVRGELQLLSVEEKPWGGVQVIAVGDFCQTQPVDKQDLKLFDTSIFKITFEAPRGATVLLTQVMRQEALVSLHDGSLQGVPVGAPVGDHENGNTTPIPLPEP